MTSPAGPGIESVSLSSSSKVSASTQQWDSATTSQSPKGKWWPQECKEEWRESREAMVKVIGPPFWVRCSWQLSFSLSFSHPCTFTNHIMPAITGLQLLSARDLACTQQHAHFGYAHVCRYTGMCSMHTSVCLHKTIPKAFCFSYFLVLLSVLWDFWTA